MTIVAFFVKNLRNLDYFCGKFFKNIFAKFPLFSYLFASDLCENVFFCENVSENVKKRPFLFQPMLCGPTNLQSADRILKGPQKKPTQNLFLKFTLVSV
jgi:hypothetical protein